MDDKYIQRMLFHCLLQEDLLGSILIFKNAYLCPSWLLNKWDDYVGCFEVHVFSLF